MSNFNLAKALGRAANFFELTVIIIILLFAFAFQFVLHELPCPLCLLQRVGFLSMAFGFLMNFRFGFRPSHYSIVLISGLYTCFVALRQIALHVIPGTEAYGSAIFGIHLYTWSFIGTTLIVVGTALLLGIDRQYLNESDNSSLSKEQIKLLSQPGPVWCAIAHILFTIVAILIVANIMSVIFECGFEACPDNPIRYQLLNGSIKM